MEASGNATFECQLDNETFVECMDWTLLSSRILMYFVIGFDGFVYSSVPIGNHTITVRGTSQDGQTNEMKRGPLEISPFLVTAVARALGTIITVTIEANQGATFECQLDDSSFVLCKHLSHNVATYVAFLLYSVKVFQVFSTQQCPVDNIPLE